jgi:hypothetical protein
MAVFLLIAGNLAFPHQLFNSRFFCFRVGINKYDIDRFGQFSVLIGLPETMRGLLVFMKKPFPYRGQNHLLSIFLANNGSEREKRDCQRQCFCHT